ncbi:MAG: hypothetical protein CMK64_05145 [Pseudoalteromonas sp.]|nr:hypothetical protein [Pseudoalteromonas sp.]|tara:strand:- start:38541 stop:39089 length:549 start_codon:yes stop_codon:yes gene_type:complete
MKFFRYTGMALAIGFCATSSFADVVSVTKSGSAVGAKAVVVNSPELPTIPHISQPKIIVEDQASKLNQLKSWCELRTNERYLIDDNYRVYGFVTRKGSLQENVEDLVKAFYPKNQGFIDKTQPHSVVSEVCVLGRTRKEVIQRIIEPYRFKKDSIIFGNFQNDIAVMFYRNDDEMSSFLRVR